MFATNFYLSVIWQILACRVRPLLPTDERNLVSTKTPRVYNVKVTGMRELNYVYAVRAATREEACEKARHEYRMDTGDVVLQLTVVKTPPTKARIVE